MRSVASLLSLRDGSLLTHTEQGGPCASLDACWPWALPAGKDHISKVISRTSESVRRTSFCINNKKWWTFWKHAFLLIPEHITDTAFCKPTQSFFSYADMEAFRAMAKPSIICHQAACGSPRPRLCSWPRESWLGKGMGLFLISPFHPVPKRSLALAQSGNIIYKRRRFWTASQSRAQEEGVRWWRLPMGRAEGKAPFYTHGTSC